MNLAGTETRPYPLSRGRADRGEVDIGLDPVLRIDKMLKPKGWPNRLGDPFAGWEPALDGCWRPTRRFLSRGGRSTAAMTAGDQPSLNPRVAKPATDRTQHSLRKLRRRNCLANPRFQRQSSPLLPDQPPARRVSDPGPAGVAARPSVATAGSKSPRLPTKPPATGGRSATGRR
jgi:hypothetical protein